MSSFLPPSQDISSLWPVSGVPLNPSEFREDGTHPRALVGFRFCPSPQDIAQFFLPIKVSGAPMPATPIKEMDVFKHNPEDLPITISNGAERWMYFFVYMTEENKERTTPGGYWKLAECNVPVEDENTKEVLALKNSFIYHTRELGPSGRYKTNWTLDEYRIKDEENLKDPKMKNWVVCRIQTTIPQVLCYQEATKEDEEEGEHVFISDTESNTDEEKPDASIASP